MDKGEFFSQALCNEIRDKFAFIDADPQLGTRLFFDNSGGSLRLKAAIDAKTELDLIPDCPERYHERADILNAIIQRGTDDILKIILGAKGGSLMTELTASQTVFQGIATIMENVEGTNAVTSNVEHPSAYDALKFYCQKNHKEFRVAEVNAKTGFVEPEKVAELVDENTILVSIMASSNISGNIMDLEEIVKVVREKNPNVYIISDAVQHVPHGLMDVDKLKLDFVNFAPYKFMASRGIGVAYVSERVSKLPHHKLLGKDNQIWELGTPTPSLYASISAVVDYVCWLGTKFINSNDRRELFCAGMRGIEMQERALMNYMIEGLRKISGVTVFLDNDDLERKDFILAIDIKGKDLTECVKEYQRRGITVYERVNTSIYSKRIVEALNFEGAIRVSPLHCNTCDEIDRFLKVTAEIVSL